MLYRLPRLTPADRATLKRIGEIRAEVGMFAQPAHRWTGSLARTQRARNARASNAIEGHQVSLEDALAIQDGLTPDQASELDAAALAGFRDAMDYLLELARDEHFRYDVGAFRAVHRLMTTSYRKRLVELDLLGRPGYADPRPGLWRRGGVAVTGVGGGIAYVGPDLALTPGLMGELADSLNLPSDESPIVRAAIAHANYVGIHPHADGNGRMSRALQTLVLARESHDLAPEFVGVEEWLAGHQLAYYAALGELGSSWQPKTSALAWVRFCLRAHLEQAQTVLERARDARKLGTRIAELVAGAGLPDRTEMALLEAAQHRPITNAGYRQQLDGEGVSGPLAAADFRRMVDLGLLELRGRGRGSYYVAGRNLLAAIEG